jgi:hypothetical protein
VRVAPSVAAAVVPWRENKKEVDVRIALRPKLGANCVDLAGYNWNLFIQRPSSSFAFLFRKRRMNGRSLRPYCALFCGTPNTDTVEILVVS